MKILSIDPATTTGWYAANGSGSVTFKVSARESKGMKFVKFRNYIRNLIFDHKIDLVVYERPSGRHFTGIRSHSNFEGVLVELCESLNIEYKEYASTAIKKFAKECWQDKTNKLNKGQMNKQKMEDYCNEVFQMVCIDDNHADACWLYHLADIEFG